MSSLLIRDCVGAWEIKDYPIVLGIIGSHARVTKKHRPDSGESDEEQETPSYPSECFCQAFVNSFQLMLNYVAYNDKGAYL